MTEQNGIKNIDSSLYPDRWIAVVRGRVVGVGLTPQQAHRAAKQSRPKDTPQLYFVHTDGKFEALELDQQVNPEHGAELKFEVDWLNRHPLLQEVIKILQTQNMEAYLVGGAVRDLLLHKEAVVDFDFAVPGGGLALARAVADALGGAFYPLDEARGTGRVIFGTKDKKTYLDFATFRSVSLLADLRDRDLTINAMALSLTGPVRLLDPLQGQLDLKRGQIRAVSSVAFQHDPIRVLRAIRQSCELDFVIEPETETYLRQAVPDLPAVSPERQRDELLKLLNTSAPGKGVRQMRRLQVLPYILPEIQALVGVEQGPPHYLDVFDHTTKAMDDWIDMVQAGLPDIPALYRAQIHQYLNEPLAGALRPGLLLPLALLWHDAGKSLTRTEDGERIRFLGHERASAQIARQTMKKLHFSHQAIDFVGEVITHHMRPLLLAAEPGQLSRRAIYRFFRDADEQKLPTGVALTLHALADQQATYPPGQGQDQKLTLQQVVEQLLSTYFEQREVVVDPTPLLTGRDLIELFSLSEGPLIGRLLNRLREAQATGQIQDRAAALAFIKSDADFVNYQNQD